MKKLILFVFATMLLASTCYAQSAEESHKALVNSVKQRLALIKNSSDETIQPLGDLDPEILVQAIEYNKAHPEDPKALEGIYYSKSMDNYLVIRYGISSCPFGYTKYSIGSMINNGCETVDEFKSNVGHRYYAMVATIDNEKLVFLD